MEYAKHILPYIQILLSLVLIVSILFQQTGLSSAFGDVESSHITRRGPEKFFFITTIVCGILFFVSSILLVVVK